MIEIPFILMPVIVAGIVVILGIVVGFMAQQSRAKHPKRDLVELDEAAWREVIRDDTDILARRFASRRDLTKIYAQSVLTSGTSDSGTDVGKRNSPGRQRTAP